MKAKKIYIWGIGGGTARIIDRWIELDKIEGFIISDKKESVLTEYMGKCLLSPQEVASISYDAIIVGSVFVENIYEECAKYGIDLEKVIFLWRGGAILKRDTNRELISDIFGDDIADIITQSWRVVDSSCIDYYDDVTKYHFRQDGIYGTDFVRMRTFELLAEQIRVNHVEGCVAELGVFRGDFTYFLNREFPDRKCFLFDTFEGFEINEAKEEQKKGIINDSVIEAYTNTSIEIVKQKLLHLENVEFRKGFFPDSLHGLDEQFAFASIDVDLEESIYHGIEYFYPRLSGGGYIMIHDYNGYLKGVKKAVARYEETLGAKMCKVPLPDTGGTLVICK